MYHMVRSHLPGSRHNKLRVTPDMFERQVRWLAASGWSFQSMSELLDADASPSEKRVCITFDDGYLDNLEQAMPILKKHGAKATLFLVADRASCPDWPAQRKASKAGSDLSREVRMNDAQVRTLLDSGCFELGSHTVTHPDLTQLDPEARKRQFTESKSTLEKLFGQTIRTFCYPFGLYSPEDPEMLRQCGYEAAVTTQQGIADMTTFDPMELPRVKVSGKEGMFAFKLRIRTGYRGWKRK